MDDEKPRNQYIYKPENIGIVIRDSLIFIVLALVLGFLLEMLIPNIKANESHLVSFLYIILQLILTIVIVYIILVFYERITKSDAYDFLGITVFLIVFLILQNQVTMRTRYLYHYFSGGNLTTELPENMNKTTFSDYLRKNKFM